MMQTEEMEEKTTANKTKVKYSIETIDSVRERKWFLFERPAVGVAAAAILVYVQYEKYFHLHKICALKIRIEYSG